MRHPEERADEYFIANHLVTNEMKLGWETKRLGNTSYFRNSNLTVLEGFVPVFVKRWEVERALMGEAFNRVIEYGNY